MTRRASFAIALVVAAVALIHNAVATAHPELPPIIYVYLTGPTGGEIPLKMTSELTVRADGSWSTEAGATGAMSADEVRALLAAADKARFRLVPQDAHCKAVHTSMTLIRAGAQSVKWFAPCGDPPDPSLLALHDLAASLTTKRPASPKRP